MKSNEQIKINLTLCTEAFLIFGIQLQVYFFLVHIETCIGI